MILFESVGPNLFVRNIAMKTIVLLSCCSAATLLCSDHSYSSDSLTLTLSIYPLVLLKGKWFTKIECLHKAKIVCFLVSHTFNYSSQYKFWLINSAISVHFSCLLLLILLFRFWKGDRIFKMRKTRNYKKIWQPPTEWKLSSKVKPLKWCMKKLQCPKHQKNRFNQV